jgi:hypothetical protein
VNSPAAWHPDPSGAHDHRYWDGERWTEHVADAGVASVDPLPDAPADTQVIDRADEPGEVDEQPAPPTGEPLGDPATPPPDTWTGATAAAPPDGGGQPAAWAGYASSGPNWGTAAAPSTGLATTALVLGIVSLPLLVFVGFGALLGIAAIVVGIVALRRANRGEAGGRGLAIGGIATGAVSVVLGILIVIALFAFGFGFAGELERCIEETGSQAVCQERLERELTERFLGE